MKKFLILILIIFCSCDKSITLIDDSNKLLMKIFDGRKITQVECRTILYILKNYKLTEEASQNFLDKLIKYE